jgi:membrane fusion protein, multidrug efflux system
VRNARNRSSAGRASVRLTLAGDKSHVYQGTIYSFGNRIDAASGTIRARAKFDNADRALLPGMFVSVRHAQATERNELLIPDRALGFDLSNKFVYVVGADSKVAYREVELGKQVQSSASCSRACRRASVDGVQHVRPNTVVAGKEAVPDAEFVVAK